ncbi:MAG: hypothetical protein MdMp014T_3019 [Treponematales bacterium]
MNEEIKNKDWCYKKPCLEVFNLYQEKWEKRAGFVDHDNELKDLFTTHPSNSNYDEVLKKVKLLNRYYKAIFNKVEPVARHIVNLNIDPRLKNADTDLIRDIAEVPDYNPLSSFASKYCSFHKPEYYPIFDSRVRAFLCFCLKQKTWGFSFDFDELFKKNSGSLRDYPAYKKVLERFRKHFGLSDFSFKKVDQYLWLAGEEILDLEKKANKKR